MNNTEDRRERERLALEAARLIKDDTLLKALSRVRQNAVDALIRADANSPTDVVRLQAKVMVCDEFMDELRVMIDVHSIDTASRIVG